MANTSNICSNLEINNNAYKDFISNNPDVNLVHHFISFQNDEQINTYNLDFSKKSHEELIHLATINLHSLNDEYNELIDALGGIHDGDGSAVWKYWKSANKKYSELTLKDLSERDLLELKFELVDIYKFILNLQCIFIYQKHGKNKNRYFERIKDFQYLNKTHYAGDLSLQDIAMQIINQKFYILNYSYILTKGFSHLNYNIVNKLTQNFELICTILNVHREELYNLFMAKNLENINRQKTGY